MRISKLSNTRPVGRATVVAAVALAALATTSGGATAAPFDGQDVSYVVRYGDLDPARPADAAKLLRRIEYAAGKVCGSESAPDLTQREVWRHCRAATVARTVREANLPMVTALAHPSAPSAALAGG